MINFNAYLVLVHRKDTGSIDVLSAVGQEPSHAIAAVADMLMEQKRDQDVIVGSFEQKDLTAMQDLLTATQTVLDNNPPPQE